LSTIYNNSDKDWSLRGTKQSHLLNQLMTIVSVVASFLTIKTLRFSIIKEVIREIRFYQRFRFSESVKSASNLDEDKTDLLRKNADKNGFDLQYFYFLKT
jgi:hypothetical protein